MSIMIILTPFVEILTIALILNYILSFFWHTRSMDLMLGATAVLLLFAITSFLHLPVLYTLMHHVVNVAAIASIVIFQPELRTTLSKLSLKGKRNKQSPFFDQFLEQLCHSVYRLAERKLGALIVIEHENKLDEFLQRGIALNAHFSSELMESIFMHATPLHDGGIIIRNSTILAASVIFPLGEDTSILTKNMGTRHRAGLSVSQITDAVVVVISEETGMVTVFRGGSMATNVKIDRFRGLLRSVFVSREKPVSILKKLKTKLLSKVKP